MIACLARSLQQVARVMLAHGEGDLTRSAHACTRRASGWGAQLLPATPAAGWSCRTGGCAMDPLAEMIRAKIKAGALPRTISFVNTWYGRGTGRQCIACEQRIAVFEIEVEGDLQDGSVLYFPGLCYRAWDAERERS